MLHEIWKSGWNNGNRYILPLFSSTSVAQTGTGKVRPQTDQRLEEYLMKHKIWKAG